MIAADSYAGSRHRPVGVSRSPGFNPRYRRDASGSPGRGVATPKKDLAMKTRLLAIASAAALAVGAITVCSTTTTSEKTAESAATKRHSIDANVDAALSRLYAQDPSARELVAKAR
ncbi:MAG TPA: hypothetical protein VGH48_05730, partial [Caldimonas sp.]